MNAKKDDCQMCSGEGETVHFANGEFITDDCTECGGMGTTRPLNWKECHHVFEYTFGPVKKCIHCGATTIASFDGKPKDILPPIVEDEP